MKKKPLRALLALWLLGVAILPKAALALPEGAPAAAASAAPAVSAYTCGKEGCYWETPMDITDTQAVWRMLTAPITVLEGNERTQIFLYDAPSEDAAPIGEITCASQGIHVLEQLDNGYSRIECYSSSFHGSKVKAWNALSVGYVPTALLVEKQVPGVYGLVVDKLTQRLYVFENGQYLDELAISTGKPNDRQPYNETRSGEFLLISRVGGFPSGDMSCAMGIRFNHGDLLHEVPYVLKENGSKYYGSRETALGTRASHGCIRVQYKRTSKGLNMKWIWDALRDQMGTRMVVWEDLPGRQIPLPDGDTPLYWNQDGRKRYHRAANCYGEGESVQPTTAFPYSQLDEPPYDQLERCPSCCPALRAAEIEAINAGYR